MKPPPPPSRLTNITNHLSFSIFFNNTLFLLQIFVFFEVCILIHHIVKTLWPQVTLDFFPYVNDVPPRITNKNLIRVINNALDMLYKG